MSNAAGIVLAGAARRGWARPRRPWSGMAGCASRAATAGTMPRHRSASPAPALLAFAADAGPFAALGGQDVGAGGPDRLRRGQGVIGALAAADDASQLVIAHAVAAVEGADAVGAVVGRGQPGRPLARRPGRAVDRPRILDCSWAFASSDSWERGIPAAAAECRKARRPGRRRWPALRRRAGCAARPSVRGTYPLHVSGPGAAYRAEPS